MAEPIKVDTFRGRGPPKVVMALLLIWALKPYESPTRATFGHNFAHKLTIVSHVYLVLKVLFFGFWYFIFVIDFFLSSWVIIHNFIKICHLSRALYNKLIALI